MNQKRFRKFSPLSKDQLLEIHFQEYPSIQFGLDMHKHKHPHEQMTWIISRLSYYSTMIANTSTKKELSIINRRQLTRDVVEHILESQHGPNGACVLVYP